MCSASENSRMVSRALLFLLALIVLLLIYCVQHKPAFPLVKLPFEYAITPPTIVAFQKDVQIIKENCTPPQQPNISYQGWQVLEPDWYLYSAYLDNRTDSSLIRIVALSDGNPSRQLFCRTWPDGKISIVRKIELWIRAWDSAAPSHYLHPYLLSCKISSVVHAVSVVSDPCQKPTNLLNIFVDNLSHYNSSVNFEKSFAVCLKPLHFTEDNAYRVLEWLELQFLLGANSIHVYVHNLHPNTRRVFEQYGSRVKLVQHTPPNNGYQTNWTELWQRRRLEVALYNDCFYHYISLHKFVVNLDLDEAIVPLVHDSWIELLDGPAYSHSASVSARNVYFFDSFGVDPSVPSHLHMLKHVYRSANFTPPGFAQKSFFNTMKAEAVAHHYALRALLRPGGTRLMSGLDIGQARLHHYRSECPSLMEKQCEEDFMRYRVKDKALWKFKKALEKSVALKLQKLGMNPEQ